MNRQVPLNESKATEALSSSGESSDQETSTEGA